jgi:parvulin-like peptidyl-prolyl isomerase
MMNVPATQRWMTEHRVINTVLLVLTLLRMTSSTFAQQVEDLPKGILARYGPGVITAAELIQRLEAVPFPGSLKGSAEEIKKKALYALIAEKLLGQEAARLGLRWDAGAQRMERELENNFIRDALFRREVSSTVRVTEDEIQEGLGRLPIEFQVLSFLVRDRTEGNRLTAFLRKTKHDSVPVTIPSSLYTQADTIRLRFGSPDATFENAVFAIKRGRVSEPFSSPMFGWVVLYIIDRLPRPDVQRMSPSERRRKSEKILRERKEAVTAQKVYYGVLQSKHADADPQTFEVLAKGLSAFWKEDTLRFRRSGGYILTSDMVDVLIDRLSADIDSTLVRFDDGVLSLGQVLEMLRYEDYLSPYYEGEEFLLDLNQELKNLTARALLAQEGRRRRLDTAPEMKADLSVWTSWLNAGAMCRFVRETVRVTEDDLLQHLLKNKEIFGRQYEVNVREVLCRSATDANSVLGQLQERISFETLATTRSIRAEWAVRGGESGFFPVIEHPEIGFRALLAEVGTVIGPVDVPGGASVFSVLAKRRAERATVGFDSLKHNITGRLLSEKRKRALDRMIASLARENQVAIDYEQLKLVTVTLIPTFTRRYIGFGGHMTAVPLFMQQWDWVKELPPAEQLP